MGSSYVEPFILGVMLVLLYRTWPTTLEIRSLLDEIIDMLKRQSRRAKVREDPFA